MGILDEIAKGGSQFKPITAFLVGRESRLNRERQTRQDQRQENIDAQNKESSDVLNDYRRLQIKQIKDEPARLAAEKALAEREADAQIAEMSKAISGNPNIPAAKKQHAIGLLQSRNPKAIQEAMDLIQDELKPKRGPLVNVQAFDPEARNRETKAERDRIRGANERTKNIIAETKIAIDRNRESPGAAGLKGAGQEFVEGTVGQIPGIGPTITGASERITGVDATELSSIRTHGRTLVARQIENIIGDDSGRYTKEEQDITRKTLSSLDALKTSDQIEGALTELNAIKVRGEIRVRGPEFISDITGKEIDITTDAGYQEWGTFLVEEIGLSAEEAFVELERHVREIGR